MYEKSELELLRELEEACRWKNTGRRKCSGACFCTGWCEGKDHTKKPPMFTGVNEMLNKIGDWP